MGSVRKCDLKQKRESFYDFCARFPFYAFPVLNLMGECYNFHMTEIKKCAMFLADGFEECEGLITVDMLRRAGITIDTISMNETDEVLTSHKIRLHADRLFRDTDITGYDVLILPGGKLGTENLEKSEELKQYLVSWNQQGKLIAAICAAPSIFGHLGLLKEKHYTCFPDFYSADYEGIYEMELSVVDGNIITGRGMGATIEFARNLIKALCDEETLQKTEYGMQYEHSFRRLTNKPE